MKTGRAQYLQDTIIISALAKSAQDQDFVSGLVEKVKEYTKSLWDPNRPAESIAALAAPGILSMLGLPWIGVVYEIAEALGFDWIGFFETVKNEIKSLVTDDVVSGKEKVDLTKADNIVNNAWEQHYTGNVDTLKLMEAASKIATSSDKATVKFIKKFAETALNDKQLIKTALPWGKLFAGPISKFFKRLIGWLIKTALISLGFAAGGALVAGTVKEVKEQIAGPSEETEAEMAPSVEAVKLKVNPQASPELTQYHPNDVSNIWMERGMSIANIEQLLVNWAVEIYPDLEKYKDQLPQSPNFKRIVTLFRQRNRGTGLSNVIVFPRPFERVIDIVDTFVGEFSEKINQGKAS